VHKIIKGHGGSIKVRTTPRKGSEFIVSLPLDRTTATNPAAAANT
jgi:signal transduction histidine kinase